MARIFILASTTCPRLQAPLAKAMLVGLLAWLVGAVGLWYWLPYQPRFTLPGSENCVSGFSPDGRILATTHFAIDAIDSDSALNLKENGPVRLWDLDTGEELGNFPTNARFAEHVEFSSDSAILVIRYLDIPDGEKRTCSIIERKTQQELATIATRREFYLDGLTPHGSIFAFNPPEHGPELTTLWDIQAGREILTFNSWRARFSPDGRWFVTGESDSEMRIRSSSTGLTIRTIALPRKDPRLRVIGVSPDASMITSDDFLGVRVWEVASGRQLVFLDEASVPRFSRNSKRMIAEYKAEEGAIFKLWDTTNWKVLAEIQVPDFPPGLNPDYILAGPGLNELRIAPIQTRRTEPGKVQRWIAKFFGFKNWKWQRETRTLNVFDIETGKQLADFSTEGYIHLAPDGTKFVVQFIPLWPRADQDECIAVFDIPPRRPIAHILLWPLPFALAAIGIFWLVRRRMSRAVFSK
jgi:hypothetical protein